jgi:transposase
MGYKEYTELEKKLICELCKLTNNLKYVSEISGAHRATIVRFLEEKDVELSRDYKDIIYKRDVSGEGLYKRAENGEEIKDIAADVGMTTNSVTRKITRYKNKFNIKKTHYGKNRTGRLDETAIEWHKLVQSGTKTMTQIACETGMSLSGVSKRISRCLKRKQETNE